MTDPTEQTLREADAAQLRAGALNDAAAMAAIHHPNYLGNAPNNTVVDAAAVRDLMGSGAIAADGFERTVERVSVTGPVGIVMGAEIIAAAAGSLSEQMFTSEPLHRRFTNVYLWQDDGWRLLARHANVRPPPG